MAKTAWKNRIVGYEEVSAEKLLANPSNWRLHPDKQRRALKGVLDKIGFVQSVVVNKNTGHLVDGHLRVELAKQKKETVPVVWVDLTVDEERAMLAALDPLAALAEQDSGALTSLLKMTDDGDLRAMLEELHKSSGIIALDEDDTHNDIAFKQFSEDEEDEAITLNPSAAVFASSNEWGIPDLDPTMLCDECPTATWPDSRVEKDAAVWYWDWGCTKLADAEDMVIGFNKADWRFDSIWNDPAQTTHKFIATGPKAILTPDYSAWLDDPAAVQIWSAYRQAWLGRYWQKAGIKVIPQLNGPMNTLNESWIVEGIPDKPPVVFMQCRTAKDIETRKMFLRGVHWLFERLNFGVMAIYGGVEHSSWLANNLPRAANFQMIPTWNWLRANYLITRGVPRN